jgi:uridylate kinase
LKATKVDGIYTADPVKDPTATKFSKLTYTEALTKSIRVMDSAAFALCMENKIPIIVFNFFEENSLRRSVCGEDVGTVVSEN